MNFEVTLVSISYVPCFRLWRKCDVFPISSSSKDQGMRTDCYLEQHFLTINIRHFEFMCSFRIFSIFTHTSFTPFICVSLGCTLKLESRVLGLLSTFSGADCGLLWRKFNKNWRRKDLSIVEFRIPGFRDFCVR